MVQTGLYGADNRFPQIGHVEGAHVVALPGLVTTHPMQLTS